VGKNIGTPKSTEKDSGYVTEHPVGQVLAHLPSVIGARRSTSSGLAIANVLGTCVQLKLEGDSLDPAHGLVAVAASRIVHSGRFVVIEKRRLAAAIVACCAAHAGKAPMHSSR
jgi:hypothetical protein